MSSPTNQEQLVFCYHSHLHSILLVRSTNPSAIQLAELHLMDAPDLTKALLPLQKDKDAKVRFQLLLTLGFVHTPESAEARNKLLFSDINDKWVQIAALSASSSQTSSLLKDVLNKFRQDVPAYASLVERLTTMVGIGGTDDDIHRLILESSAGGSDKQAVKSAAILHGLAQGLETRKSPLKISQKDQQLLVKILTLWRTQHEERQPRRPASGDHGHSDDSGLHGGP